MTGTREGRRIKQTAAGTAALEPLGPVPVRARLGHGARGLQRRRHGLGLLPPRPRALARLPLERGRARRHLRPHQLVCFALALWNGKDPILKERPFGLTNSEGNHGEDVKEYWFYLDSTPTHSYMKYLYKYPQAEYPYAQLIEENRAARSSEPEYELLDTGIFAESRYFDVFVEYAKAAPEDILIEITVENRGPEAATPRPAAHRLVPQHLVVGPGAAAALASPRPISGGRPAIVLDDPGHEPAVPPLPAGRRAALHRERDQRRAASSARRTRRPTSRTPSTSTSIRGRRAPSTPRERAPRPRRVTGSRSPPAAARACGCA